MSNFNEFSKITPHFTSRGDAVDPSGSAEQIRSKGPPPSTKDFKELLKEGESGKSAKARQKGKEEASDSTEEDTVDVKKAPDDRSGEKVALADDTSGEESAPLGGKTDARAGDVAQTDARTADVSKADAIKTGIAKEASAPSSHHPALAKGKLKEEVASRPVSEEEVKQSPFAVYKQVAKKEKAFAGDALDEAASFKRAFAEAGDERSKFAKLDEKKQEAPAFAFSEQQPDLSRVNPLQAAGTFQEVSSVAPEVSKTGPVASAELQAVVEKLIDKLYVLRTEGKTETIISLKNTPVFEGAQLVVTAYDSARGEFNLSFENLTLQAKQLLEMQSSQDGLRNALAEKGYMVHIVTTTTTIENRVLQAEAGNAKGREGKEQDSGDQPRQGQKKG